MSFSVSDLPAAFSSRSRLRISLRSFFQALALSELFKMRS